MKRMQKMMLATMLGAAVLASPVMAQSFGGMPMMPVTDGVLVNLAASARKTVTQDKLQATVSMEKDGKTAQEVQSFINKKMQDAGKIYAKYPTVKVSTGGYNVWRQYEQTVVDNNGKVKETQTEKWHGSQQLILQGGAQGDLLKLLGELQGAGFASQGMNYYLSTEESEKLTDDLTKEALGKIRARAKKIGEALEMGKVEFLTVNTEGSMPPMVPMMAYAKAGMARDSAEMATPVGQAGETEVVVNVQATVKLKK